MSKMAGEISAQTSAWIEKHLTAASRVFESRLCARSCHDYLFTIALNNARGVDVCHVYHTLEKI